jgi:hypothetical protein
VPVRVRTVCAPLVVAVALMMTAASPVRKTASPSCQVCHAEASDSPDPRVVRIWMFNQTHMSDGNLDDIMAIANRIWAPYGITIQRDESVEAVKVIVSANMLRSETSTVPMALGDTLFTGGHATPYIHLWLGAAEALAAGSELDGRSFTSRSSVERDVILRQMLGVALAHEIGHYLLDSSHHSSAGLLRQTLSVSDLAFPKPAHLRLTDAQQHVVCLRRDAMLTEGEQPAVIPDRTN